MRRAGPKLVAKRRRQLGLGRFEEVNEIVDLKKDFDVALLSAMCPVMGHAPT